MTQAHLRILLVDDELSLRKPLTEYMTRTFGFEVFDAADCSQALKLIELHQGRFDVALIDQLLLPPPDGIEVMRQIKAQYPEIECIIFTGWGPEHRQQALREGAFRYVEKPFEYSELEMLIRTAAQQVRLRAISREILSQHELAQVFAQIAAATRSLALADESVITLVESSTEQLTTYQGLDTPVEPGMPPSPVAGPITQAIVAAGKLATIAEIEQDGEYSQLLEYGFHSLVGVPIPGENENLGVLYALGRRAGQFDAGGTIALLQTLAGQAGLAIANAAAFQQLKAHDQYMGALVQIGQQLTRAMNQEEQLGLVWKFVADQLKVTTFFVALYDSVLDTVSFPLFHDGSEIHTLPDRTLGSNVDEWGITGHVIRTGEEVFWPTPQIKQIVFESRGIKSKQVGDPCHSCFYFPLKVGFQVIGAISVQAYDAHAFPPALLDACRALGNQLVVALENMRLMKEAQRQASDLESLQRLSVAIASSLNRDQVMTRTCQAAVEFFHADHSGLVLFDRDFESGVVAAEYPPEINTLGSVVPLRNVPAEQRLIDHGEPLIIEDVASEQDFGPGQNDLIEKYGIRSMLIVPVVSRGRLLGSFSVDSMSRKRRFLQLEVELSKIFAAQVAVAIENARLYEEVDRRNRLMAAMEEASRHIRGETPPTKLMPEIVRVAAQLIHCSAGCIFLNAPHRRELELVDLFQLPAGIKGSVVQHGAGVVGAVAQMGELQIWPDQHKLIDLDPPFANCGFGKAIGVPLRQAEQVTGVLLLADQDEQRDFLPEEIDILERFAAQAAIALQTSQAMTLKQQRTSQITTLQQMGSYIQAAQDVEKTLHLLATGVTAGYGLGFNRVAILLFNGSEQELEGRMGVGYFSKADWRKAISLDKNLHADDLERYIERLEQGELRPTPIQVAVASLRLPIHQGGEDLFSTIVRTRRTLLVEDAREQELPMAFKETFRSVFPFVITPLVARDRTLGILVADNKYTRSPITKDLIESLMTFVNTACVAIDNMTLFAEARQSEERLRKYYEASNALVTSHDLRQVLQEIVERAREAAKASRVFLIIFENRLKVRGMIVSGADQPLDVTELVRPTGYSLQVMEMGNPVVIEDTHNPQITLNPSRVWHGVRSAICLPLMLEGERHGVMWFCYDIRREFSSAEIKATQLYVNQAAIAHDAARRVDELKQMQRAAEVLSRAHEPGEVLQRIVECAAAVLHADSTVLWSFDDEREKFIPAELTSVGLPAAEIDIIRTREPKPGHTTETVMQNGYLPVPDVAQREIDYLGQQPSDNLLDRIGVRSFQAALLRVGSERLGVLYANYQHPKHFNAEDQGTALTFASHASQALKTARLVTQLDRTRRAAGIVAGAVVQQELDQTLSQIARMTREVLDADIVTLYAFDEMTHTFTGFGADVIDQIHQNSILNPEQLVAGNSAVSRILEIREPPYVRIADNAVEDPLLRGNFVWQEQVQASIAAQLRAGSSRVGVMFVNYRTQRRFREDEISTVRLFADQAAAAIRNTHLYRQTVRLLEQSRLESDISREAASNLEIGAFLETLFLRLTTIFADRKIGIFLRLAMYDEATRSLTTYTTRFYPSSGPIIPLSIETDGGIVAWVARNRMPYYAPHTESDGVYTPLLHETKSEIAVPVLFDRQLLAVLDLESPVPDAFNAEDQELLANLASKLAVTIHNVRQYTDLWQTKGLVGARTAVAWMGMVSADWVHNIRGNIATIRDSVQLLRSDLQPTLTESSNELFDRVERRLKEILETSITAPLHPEEGAEQVPIAKLIRERVRQLIERDRYRALTIEFQRTIDEAVLVRCNSQWLIRVLDTLVDNAAAAIVTAPIQRITVKVSAQDEPFGTLRNAVQHGLIATIEVSDTGAGIPADTLKVLFRAPIKKTAGSKGSGIGLLLAQTIVQTYGGDIHVGETGATGTTMVFWLPIDK